MHSSSVLEAFFYPRLSACSCLCFPSLSLISWLNKPLVSCLLSSFSSPHLFLILSSRLLPSFAPSFHSILTLKPMFGYLLCNYSVNMFILTPAAVFFARTGSPQWLRGQLGIRWMYLQDVANECLGLGIDGVGMDDELFIALVRHEWPPELRRAWLMCVCLNLYVHLYL